MNKRIRLIPKIMQILSGKQIRQTGSVILVALGFSLLVGNQNKLFGQFTAKEKQTSGSENDFMQYYNRMDYRSCVSYFQENNDKTFNSFAMEIYAECLFQLKKLNDSASLLKSLVIERPDSRQRAFSRLIDIYRMGGGKETVKDILDFLRKNPSEEAFIQKIQTALLDMALIKEFVEMYKISPISIISSQWNQIIAGADEDSFDFLVATIKYPSHYKTLLTAKFYFAQKKFEKAEALLLNSLNVGENTEIRLLLADIYWNNQNQEKAIETVLKLKSYGTGGYRSIAQFFFEHGAMKNSHTIVDEGIQKGYALYDLKIFYTMAEGRHSEAAYLLEIYNEQKRLMLYDYNRLNIDFQSQGSAKDYWEGLRKAEQVYPQLCEKSIYKAMEWADDKLILQSIEECPAIKQPHTMQTLLYNLDNAAKHSVIIQVFEKKIQSNTVVANDKIPQLSEQESFLLAKSYLITDKNKILRALELLKSIENNQNSYLRQETSFLLARAAMLNGNYDEAYEKFKKVIHLDKENLRIWCLYYSGRWQDFSEQVNQPATFIFSGTKEADFFKAIYHLSQKQQSQTITLLEKYLNDPGAYGNQAVYILFLLKYFSAQTEIEEFVLDLIGYPNLRKTPQLYRDQELLKILAAKINENVTEFEIFKFVWAVRFAIAADSKIDFKIYLEKMAGLQQATLLEAEINYLITVSEKIKKKELENNFLLKFPDSPFKLLLKEQ